MSPQSLVAHATYDSPRLMRRVLAVSAAGLIVLAIALSAALSGPRSTGATAALPAAQSAYVPLIHYRGTGAPPVAARRLVTMAPPTRGLLRAEHSYGAVP